MAKNFFITKDKKQAKTELKKIFKKHIINDIIVQGGSYCIYWIDQKDFYKQAVESQKEMDKYLLHLLNKLEPKEKQVEIKTDEQIEQDKKDEEFKALGKVIKKKSKKSK